MSDARSQLLSHYVQAHSPSTATAHRNLQIVESRLAAGDPGMSLATAAAGTSAVPWKAFGAGMLAAGLIAAVVYLRSGSEPQRGEALASTPALRAEGVVPLLPVPPPAPDLGGGAPSPPPAPVPVQDAEASPEASVLGAVTETAAETVSPPPKVKRSPPKAAKQHSKAKKPAAEPVSARGASTLKEEMQLLARGQRELQVGRPGDALSYFEEHRRRFPSGVMKKEREAKIIVAHCELGHLTEASRRREAFMRRYPDSPLAASVAGVCK